ncbi:Uncharacterised protein [Mycobacteroides abscessus subsp. abscessus]|nr:Uncharacterised protein [Mycobacteroides abscessus subsp. abscessus]SHT05560.1 Uncharacterised protein [Mycobacteroides abscessus subsp. abscessus]
MVESGPSPYRWIGTNRSDVLRDCGGLLAELDTVIDGIFRRAAAKALLEWGWDESQYLDDLTQSMWVWYLERPSVQTQFAQLIEDDQTPLVRKLANSAAEQLLSEERYELDLFEQKALYSSDSVREALRGESTNKYLMDALPIALESVCDHNQEHGEALRSRYVDGFVPVEPQKSVLKRAVKSLTEEVNAMYIADDVKGIGSKDVMFPEQRKRKGQHGDPTGDVAMALIEHGDNIIPVVDRTGGVTAITTYRREFYGDEPIRRPV